MKTCTGCHEEKPLSSFYERRKGSGKLMPRCKTCNNNYSTQWQKDHKEVVAKRAAAWRAANPAKAREVNIANLRKRRAENIELIREQEREASRNRDKSRVKLVNQTYYLRNKDKILKRGVAYDKANPESRIARRAKRRAKEFCATPSWANQFFIKEAYHLAKLRKDATGFKWHVDHIVPLNSKLVCGLHVEHNLQVIPATENIRKSNLSWPDMF